MKNALKLFVVALFASTLLVACGGKKKCENKEETATTTEEVAPVPAVDSTATVE